MPSATDNTTTASIMVTTSTPSSAKTCNRWGPPCSFCIQSTQHSSPVDSNWSEEDWDRKIEKEKRKEKQRKEEEMRQRQEEKIMSDPNYYPSESIYVPNHEEQLPTLVNSLILAPENSKTPERQSKMKGKTRQKRTEE